MSTRNTRQGQPDPSRKFSAPKLKYKRISGKISEILSKDVATSMDSTNDCVVIGTKSGKVYAVSAITQEICEMKLKHSDVVTSVCIDNRGEYIVSVSLDSHIYMFTLDGQNQLDITAEAPILSISLCCDFDKTNRNFVIGCKNGAVVLYNEKKILGMRDTKIYLAQDRETGVCKDIICVSCTKTMVAFCDGSNVIVYDFVTKSPLCLVEKSMNSLEEAHNDILTNPPKLFLKWESPCVLLIGCEDTVQCCFFHGGQVAQSDPSYGVTTPMTHSIKKALAMEQAGLNKMNTRSIESQDPGKMSVSLVRPQVLTGEVISRFTLVEPRLDILGLGVFSGQLLLLGTTVQSDQLFVSITTLANQLLCGDKLTIESHTDIGSTLFSQRDAYSAFFLSGNILVQVKKYEPIDKCLVLIKEKRFVEAINTLLINRSKLKEGDKTSGDKVFYEILEAAVAGLLVNRDNENREDETKEMANSNSPLTPEMNKKMKRERGEKSAVQAGRILGDNLPRNGKDFVGDNNTTWSSLWERWLFILGGYGMKALHEFVGKMPGISTVEVDGRRIYEAAPEMSETAWITVLRALLYKNEDESNESRKGSDQDGLDSCALFKDVLVRVCIQEKRLTNTRGVITAINEQLKIHPDNVGLLRCLSILYDTSGQHRSAFNAMLRAKDASVISYIKKHGLRDAALAKVYEVFGANRESAAKYFSEGNHNQVTEVEQIIRRQTTVKDDAVVVGTTSLSTSTVDAGANRKEQTDRMILSLFRCVAVADKEANLCRLDSVQEETLLELAATYEPGTVLDLLDLCKRTSNKVKEAICMSHSCTDALVKLLLLDGSPTALENAIDATLKDDKKAPKETVKVACSFVEKLSDTTREKYRINLWEVLGWKCTTKRYVIPALECIKENVLRCDLEWFVNMLPIDTQVEGVTYKIMEALGTQKEKLNLYRLCLGLQHEEIKESGRKFTSEARKGVVVTKRKKPCDKCLGVVVTQQNTDIEVNLTGECCHVKCCTTQDKSSTKVKKVSLD